MNADAIKRCSRCRAVMAAAKFGNDRSQADGLSHRCRVCSSAHARSIREKDPLPNRTRVAAWQRANPDLHRANVRRNKMARAYGITPDQYDLILLQQLGLCAISGEMPPTSRRLEIDHDHTLQGPASVRGLILPRFNKALGFFKDNVADMLRVADIVDAARAAGEEPQGLTPAHRMGLGSLKWNTNHLRACAAYIRRHHARVAAGVSLVAEVEASVQSRHDRLEATPGNWGPDPFMAQMGLAAMLPQSVLSPTH
jgi:hypothetical protein